jgi:hypothetical protein
MEHLLKRQSSEHEVTLNCHQCEKDIDFDLLLSKYGPEGLYEIADKLKAIADDDVSKALNGE